jgi:hypothetical protein
MPGNGAVVQKKKEAIKGHNDMWQQIVCSFKGAYEYLGIHQITSVWYRLVVVQL